MSKENKVQVLFICTGNSARSQMAEGLLRKAAGDIADVYSAGTKPAHDVNPLAKEMMIENGIDPSEHRPEKIDQHLDKEYDIIVTTCDKAKESCPFFPGNVQRFHWGLEDPAAVEGDKSVRLAAFRKTFAELSQRIVELVKVIQKIHARAE